MLSTSHTSNGQRISRYVIATLYKYANFGGWKWEISTIFMPNRECYHLPVRPYGRVSSINTHDNCVILYEEYGCFARRLIVHPQTPFHDNLGECGWLEI